MKMKSTHHTRPEFERQRLSGNSYLNCKRPNSETVGWSTVALSCQLSHPMVGNVRRTASPPTRSGDIRGRCQFFQRDSGFDSPVSSFVVCGNEHFWDSRQAIRQATPMSTSLARQSSVRNRTRNRGRCQRRRSHGRDPSNQHHDDAPPTSVPFNTTDGMLNQRCGHVEIFPVIRHLHERRTFHIDTTAPLFENFRVCRLPALIIEDTVEMRLWFSSWLLKVYSSKLARRGGRYQLVGTPRGK